MIRLDLKRAAAAVQSRTEHLEVEHLQIASQWSLKLIQFEEVPIDRRRQDLLAHPRSRAMEGDGNGGRSPSGTVTREDEVGKPATSSKRKSSTSATRNESEARLRRQLQHNTEKLERSERARTELENRLILYQDVLAHRDQMINNVEVYSQQHHEEYQEHVNSEMEFMRRSLINAYNILDEQSTALAEAHLMDEGSTQRIIELERRGQLAEAGAAHIVQESVAMKGRYLTELENASQLIKNGKTIQPDS